MKFLLTAVLLDLLIGWAAQPLRFVQACDKVAPIHYPSAQIASSPQTAADDQCLRRASDYPTICLVPQGSPVTADSTPVQSRSQSADPRAFGAVDSLTDRLPSLLSGTLFAPLRPESTPSIFTTNSRRFTPLAAAGYPVQWVSYVADANLNHTGTIESQQQGDLVFLPDSLHDPAEPTQLGQPPIWVGVDKQSGCAVSVIIDDHPSQATDSYFQRLMQRPLVHNLVSDERNFYSCGSMAWLGVGLGASAILANTNLDEQFRQAVHGPANAHNQDLMWAKDLGTGQYVIPGLAAIYVADYWLDYNAAPGERPVAESLEQWSGRSLRGMAVGAVPVLALQYIIGSSRPGESSAGSKWKPFQDNNGVSGHAFIGAVPFWTAAQMTDNIPLEVVFYAGGTLAGISRIHDDAHYLSQVVMGWWIAGLSVAAVNCTQLQNSQWQVMPLVMENGTGIGALYQW